MVEGRSKATWVPDVVDLHVCYWMGVASGIGLTVIVGPLVRIWFAL